MAVDQNYCNDNPHGWMLDTPEFGPAECLGVLEAADLPAFLTAYGAGNIMLMSPDQPIENLQVVTKPFAFRWVTPRNHVMPADEVRQWGKEGKSNALMFSGELNVTQVPMIWKFQSALGAFYHIDWVLKPECEQFCHDWGCEFDDGENRIAENGTVCGWQCEYDEFGNEISCPDMNGGPQIINVSGDPMTKENITSVVWHNGPNGAETVTIYDSPVEDFNFMKYDMGQNFLESYGWMGGEITLYSNVFSDHALPGPNTWTVNANNGGSYTFTIDVPGPIREMPVVPAKILTQEYETKTLGKSGKVIGTLSDVEIDNIKAREITDEDGNTRLLIQWAEPDLAMKFSENQKDVRLRIYVGHTKRADCHDHFLWMDIPVTSGSCVVSATDWQELKQILLDKGETEVAITGQYREQYNNLGYDGDTGLGYHNRGYFGVILFPIN
jgi:hypothetical protein